LVKHSFFVGVKIVNWTLISRNEVVPINHYLALWYLMGGLTGCNWDFLQFSSQTLTLKQFSKQLNTFRVVSIYTVCQGRFIFSNIILRCTKSCYGIRMKIKCDKFASVILAKNIITKKFEFLVVDMFQTLCANSKLSI